MKRIIFSALVLSGVVASAQDSERYGRVGINTTEPNASLEIRRHTGVNAKNPQGFLLPNLTQEQRNSFEQSKLQIGLQIFNTTKNCIDWWTGKNWQCTDGTLKDNHGDAPQNRVEEKWWEPNDITVYKNNCPVGQQATSSAKFVISHSIPSPNPAIEGEGVGFGYTLVEARDKALAAAKTDFYRKVQDYVNGLYSNSTHCEDIPTRDPDRPVVVQGSGNFATENRSYFFSTIDDDDYLPLKTHTGSATLEKLPADGRASGSNSPLKEKAIKVIAKIPTIANAIQILIPIKLTSGSNLMLSEHIHHIDIPGEYTADGRPGVMTMYWDPVNINNETRYIKAKFYAQNEEITLKGLDLIGGLGEDHMGIVFGTFKYPKNINETTIDQMTGKYELRMVSGVLDKNFMFKSNKNGEEDYRHRFVYAPVMAADGKIWLNNNLGAHYADINHPEFNTGQTAKNNNDYLAYGSLSRWGDRHNGRELYTYTAANDGTQVFAGIPGYTVGSDTPHSTTYYENCPDKYGASLPEYRYVNGITVMNLSGAVEQRQEYYFKNKSVTKIKPFGMQLSSSIYKDGGWSHPHEYTGLIGITESGRCVTGSWNYYSGAEYTGWEETSTRCLSNEYRNRYFKNQDTLLPTMCVRKQ